MAEKKTATVTELREGIMKTDASPPTAATEEPRARRGRGRPRHGRAVARDLSRDEEILKIAAEVLYKKGFAGAKLNDIAVAAGIAKGSLYHYFSSKEEIYERLIKNVRGTLDFEREVHGKAPAAKRLEHLLRTRLTTTVEYPLEVGLLAHQLIHLEGPAGDWARQDPKNYFNAIRQIILQGQREEAFRAVDPDAIASTILHIFANVPNWYRRGGRIAPDALVDELTTFIMQGLLKKPKK
jgi:TetR/AcrR family transcriptional regulator, cholesterol catabolism regulator